MKKILCSKAWILIYFVLIVSALTVVAVQVIHIDPFFHYHQPDTEEYFYSLDNDRSQNDGIVRHFDYDTLITGTSMTQNFKSSEMDEIFGTNSIKVPYSGGSYKEVNDNLAVALEHNPNLKTIVRGLDIQFFLDDKDTMFLELKKYPTYLYDDNIFNDVNYIFNRNVVFDRIYSMILEKDTDNFKAGITSFDAYKNWMEGYTFGINTVSPDGITVLSPGEPVYLTEEEKNIVMETIQQNIIPLAEAYPDVTFYYFFTPYSAVWWKEKVDDGTIYKLNEAETIYIEQILKYDNIKLFSFNNLTDITTDINHYKDKTHYGSWINSLMLKYMHDDECLLTYENYKEYLDYELNYYLSFDYNSLNGQVDYENDYYAEALLNEMMGGVTPLEFSYDLLSAGNYNKASLSVNESGEPVIVCQGSLSREAESEISAADYIAANEYVGFEVVIEDISDYKYLVFYGQKIQEHGQPTVYIYDVNGTKAAEYTADCHNLDNEKHQYLIDVSELSGSVRIIFNGGYIDNTGSEDSTYMFTDMVLY